MKPTEEGHIIEFNSNDDPTAKCYKCKNLFRPEHLQCTIVAPDIENSRRPCKIKWMHFRCKTGQQHKSFFDRVRSVSTIKGFSALAPEHQESLRNLYPEAPFFLNGGNKNDEDARPADAADDSGNEEGGEYGSVEWQLNTQEAWANFLVAAVHDAKLLECAAAEDFNRDDMSIEIRRVSRPFAAHLEEQGSRIACLIQYCRNMQEEDIRTIARTLATQIRRDRRKDTREHRNLARIATEGEGHVVTTLLVHGHYRGRFSKGDPLHFHPFAYNHTAERPETIFVYNNAWEQVGELTQTAATLLAPLLRHPDRFRFTNHVRMGNLNSSTGVVHRVTLMPVDVTVDIIRATDELAKALTSCTPQTIIAASTEPRILGMLPLVNDPDIQLVTVICPSVPELGGSFTLRWWPGDEDDCFFDIPSTDARPTGAPRELMLQYSDGTELLSLEEEWERATGESLGAVERRYSVPVGSCLMVCTRAERATVAVLHTPRMY